MKRSTLHSRVGWTEYCDCCDDLADPKITMDGRVYCGKCFINIIDLRQEVAYNAEVQKNTAGSAKA